MSRIRNITTALAAVLLTAPAFAYDIQTPGNDTKLSVYGFVYSLSQYYTTGASQSNSSDLNQTSQGGNVLNQNQTAPHQFVMSVQPSRYGFATVTPTAAYGDITTKIEFDMNNYTQSNAFHLRHAYATVGNWLFGQTWSNYVDGDAMPDAIDWQGPVGASGFDTPRRPQIRYTFNFDKNNKLAISLEKQQGLDGDTYSYTPATGTTANAGKVPTVVAAYTMSDSWGHIKVAGIAINHSEYVPATNVGGVATASTTFGTTTYGGMVSGDVKFGKDDLVASVSTGKGLDDWAAGEQGVTFVNAPGNQTTYAPTSFGWTIGYTHVFSSQWRANVYASGLNYGTVNQLAYTQPTTVAGTGIGTKSHTDVAANAFYTINKAAQVGLEYFYENAKTYGQGQVLGSDGLKGDEAQSGRFELLVKVQF